MTLMLSSRRASYVRSPKLEKSGPLLDQRKRPKCKTVVEHMEADGKHRTFMHAWLRLLHSQDLIGLVWYVTS